MSSAAIHRSSARLYRGTGYAQRTKLSAYDELSMKVGPQVTSNGPMAVVPMSGPGMPADLDLPYPQYEPSSDDAYAPSGQFSGPGGAKTTSNPAQFGTGSFGAPQGGAQQGSGMPPEVVAALMNLGQTGVSTVRDIATTAITQGAITDRTRFEMDMRREILRMQSQGLITPMQAQEALAGLQGIGNMGMQGGFGMQGGLMGQQFGLGAQGQFMRPGWFNTLTPVQQLLLVGGVVGAGVLVYRATRK